MAELVRDAPTSVLACYAHPDDPEVSCGGTLARWSAAGSEVHTVVCTSGDKGSSDPATDPVELVSRRTQEVAAAARLVGLTGHHHLGHPDGELENGVDLPATLDVKLEAVLCHRSQLTETGEWLRTVIRERAEEGGRQAGVRYAEGFRRLRLTG